MIKRCTISCGVNMLTYYCRLAAGVAAPLERLSLRRDLIPAVALELGSAFACQNALSPGNHSGVDSARADYSTSNCIVSSANSAAPSWRGERFDIASSFSRFFWEADRGRFDPCESGWTPSSNRLIHNLATTAVDILESPVKTWSDTDSESTVVIEENDDGLVPAVSMSHLDGIPHVNESLKDDFEVVNQPGTSACNFADLEEKLKVLETCGLGSNRLERVRQRLSTSWRNTLLKISLKKLIEVVAVLEEVGVEKSFIGNLLFANPYAAGSNIENCLRHKIAFLESRGVSKEQMGKMILRAPQILTYSLEGKVLPIEQKLRELGLKGHEIRSIFVKHPAVFGTSITKFDRNVQCLKDGGIHDVANAVFKIPQIMSLSLDRKIEQLVQFLRDEFQLEPQQVSKMLRSQIKILSFSTQGKMRPKVEYFYQMGLEKHEVARLFVKYPNLFCHSLDNSIKPKLSYLVNDMHHELREILKFPHYLGYSLRNRIIPRHEYVVKHGFSFKLASLLSCTEDVFNKRYSS